MTDRMRDKVVVVTGGASGMGLGISINLAEEGASVVLADLDGAKAENAAAALREKGLQALAVQGNITSRDDMEGVVRAAVKEFGRLDVWFNNAGYNRPMNLLDITPENWHAIMDVNGLGTLIGTQVAATQFIAQGGGGKIINTSSQAGRQGFPSHAPYCASKAAIISLTQAAARGLAQHDITVNAFAPGIVDTPLWIGLEDNLLEIGETTRKGEAMEVFAEGIIRGRVAQVSDIVGTTLYLASSDSDYLTGQVVMIDGGMVLV
jgi:meso-butanediol dehydrogenase / (S,S)-butanediol dehydrogenase / diacetyl reductase